VAKKQKNWPSSEFGTKFQRELSLFWIYRNSLTTQCKSVEGSLCATNLDLFCCFDKILPRDGQTACTALCICTSYGSRGKNWKVLALVTLFMICRSLALTVQRLLVSGNDYWQWTLIVNDNANIWAVNCKRWSQSHHRNRQFDLIGNGQTRFIV